jgi:hypothetical protein
MANKVSKYPRENRRGLRIKVNEIEYSTVVLKLLQREKFLNQDIITKRNFRA